ncbi:hypothetical protein [Chitinimonas koreensis]|uniref:hypothetical protein n=1 Tax=Chitinimonas koreensis TaxID=356302 RepID=UPI0004244FDD|nr:hypothetical protein [Chitinimonas koreensis]QNM96522.1 hypothetical protein H9L41_22595 [Chitinimonas koreensis]
MAHVYVLLAVDVQAALLNGIAGNVQLVDSRKHTGDAVTALHPGDSIAWRIAPLQPGKTVAIEGFAGAAVADQVIAPERTEGKPYWHSRVGQESGSHPYTVALQLEGKPFSFDATLQVKHKH